MEEDLDVALPCVGHDNLAHLVGEVPHHPAADSVHREDLHDVPNVVLLPVPLGAGRPGAALASPLGAWQLGEGGSKAGVTAGMLDRLRDRVVIVGSHPNMNPLTVTVK